jgi:hypothetical protein
MAFKHRFLLACQKLPKTARLSQNSGNLWDFPVLLVFSPIIRHFPLALPRASGTSRPSDFGPWAALDSARARFS